MSAIGHNTYEGAHGAWKMALFAVRFVNELCSLGRVKQSLHRDICGGCHHRKPVEKAAQRKQVLYEGPLTKKEKSNQQEGRIESQVSFQ
jgi:hypothetical protein